MWQLERVCSLMSNFGGHNAHSDGQSSFVLAPSLDLEMSMYPRHFQEQTTVANNFQSYQNPCLNEGVMIMEDEKRLALEMALTSVDELIKMCHIGQPLWYNCSKIGKEVLNIQEYEKLFPWAIDNDSKRKSSDLMIRTEATRETSVVIMNSITLVDAFMDSVSTDFFGIVSFEVIGYLACTKTNLLVTEILFCQKKMIDMFPSIISKAKTIQAIISGAPGYANGSLLLVSSPD